VAFLKQQGLTIVEVNKDSPAKKLTDVTNASRTRELQVGDVVSQINGKPITSIQDYFDRMKQVGKVTTIKVQNADNGAESQWLVNPIAVNVPDHLAPTGKVTGARVHVIHAAVTDDANIGRSIRQDLDQFEQCVRKLVGGNRLASFKRLSGTDCTDDRIKKTIGALDVKNNDSVFFYYQGHGAYDPKLAPNDPSRGHFLKPLGSDLKRSELLKLLAAKRPRFTLLVSDCCNQPAEFFAEVDRFEEARTITGWSKLEDLLLCHRGIVDLTASSPDEASWFDKYVGGWFTEVFITELDGAAEENARHWSEFVGGLGSKIDDLFVTRKKQIIGSPGFKPIKEDLAKTGTLGLLNKQKTMHPAIFTMDMQREEPADPPREARIVNVTVTVFRPVEKP
jgi:hypothetical protein